MSARQDYGALYDTEVHDNFKNVFTKKDFVNLKTIMNSDRPIDEYKSVITGFYNSFTTSEDECKQIITIFKKYLSVKGTRLDIRLNQDGVDENYKTLLSHIINNVLDEIMIKSTYFPL